MNKPSDFKLRSAHETRPDKFFGGENAVHEKELHPQTVIKLLKDELRRSQEHVYELYKHIADYAAYYEKEHKEKK